jgi:heme-degrading monooxygenase HmoA
MILEAAPLQVKPGQSQAFEAAFREAQQIISGMPGYRSHELQRCLECEGQMAEAAAPFLRPVPHGPSL